MKSPSTGFIGTGRIAQALISGLARQQDSDISGFDKDSAALHTVAGRFGIRPANSITELAGIASIIVIAVKPYQVAEVLDELNPSLQPGHLLVSVAAGISTEFIASRCPSGTRVIRVMPNTPAFVGLGMTALCRGTHATDNDIALAEALFSAIGRTAVIDESGMDAATAVSGSGPAYMFRIIDALAEGGAATGLDRETSMLLAAQTMLGAAKMVLESTKSPEELVREVTTPGGTTESGLNEMDRHGVREALVDTVKAAASRSRELMK
ncbi:MAG: pyrroline-5-carboxylate reductase [Chlorobiaceae bacterium]|nr:pyrroline-5-carboxylate reductase [Chlorobiaceae bacterium]NTW74664.1 pyrroline-5-carboxylate reductase [Chlorobiaceae bacterium]